MVNITISSKRTIHDNLFEQEIEYRVVAGGELKLISYTPRGYPEPRKRKIVLAEAGAVSEVFGAFAGKDDEELNLTIDTIHAAPNTTGRTEFRAVLNHASSFEFRGMIKILPGAQGSQDFLQQDSLLLSDQAKANAIPGLEIEADDVKASHGATAKPVDREQVFYLMARGLTKIEAERMIVEGFLAPIEQYLHESV